MNNTTPYSEGSLDAPICIVVEAPGSVEIYKDRPLVGPAGSEADKLFHMAGLIRRELRIENTVRSRINDVKEFITEKALTDKGKAAAADLRSRLNRCKANVFVPMGNLALAAMTDQYGGRDKKTIGKLRGSILESSLLPGRKIIPTWHPASVLPGRSPYYNRYTIVEDLKKALRQSEFPEIRYPKRQLLINPLFHNVMEFLDAIIRLEFGPLVAFDIEIYNFQVSCISFAPQPDLCMSIPFIGDCWSEHEEAAIWRKIAELLGCLELEKIAHWTVFDTSFLLMQNKIRIRGVQHCTATMHRIINPDFSAKLEFLTSYMTDEPYYKDDRKLWARPFADPDRFYRYNCKDSCITREVFPDLLSQINEDEFLRWTYENTMSMLEPCLFVQSRGIQLDVERLKDVKERVKTELAAKEKELDEVAETPFNPVGPQALRYFYGIKGIKPYINRKTGRPTCDDTALSRIIRKYNLPEARLAQQIRALRKLQSTYLNLDYDKDERLRCLYDPRGTTTGRLSSKKTVFETGLDMQNLDPRFKYFLVPG
jgi:uracil-DNA glycosylase family 4